LDAAGVQAIGFEHGVGRHAGGAGTKWYPNPWDIAIGRALGRLLATLYRGALSRRIYRGVLLRRVYRGVASRRCIAALHPGAFIAARHPGAFSRRCIAARLSRRVYRGALSRRVYGGAASWRVIAALYRGARYIPFHRAPGYRSTRPAPPVVDNWWQCPEAPIGGSARRGGSRPAYICRTFASRQERRKGAVVRS
jgi:hypothetical protein